MVCIVQVVQPGLEKAQTYFAEGLPRTTSHVCKGGSNIVVEFFVPTRRGPRQEGYNTLAKVTEHHEPAKPPISTDVK